MGNSSNGRDRLLTIQEVADLLQVPTSWLYSHSRKRSKDRIPAVKVGKYVRFNQDDVTEWIERHKTGTKANA
jgi:excisionase family DNA binding protein